jgi:hypothetical protein
MNAKRKSSDQFDLFGEPPEPPPKDERDERAAKQARDEGIAQVDAKSAEWQARAFAAIRLLFQQTTWIGTGEDLRFQIYPIVGEPRRLKIHHNVWGSVIKQLVARKMIVPTGQERHMRARKSHARITKVYRST